MSQTIPSIAQILVAPSYSLMSGSAGPISIGILSDSGQVFWGDYLSDDAPADRLITIERLADRCLSKVQGHPLSGFRALWRSVQPVFPPDHGRVPEADGVGAAIQQALLAAVSTAQQCTVADLLTNEYAQPNLDPAHADFPVLLEISDFAATAAGIEHMLALRPGGIGYRLTGGRAAEALGESGEYLQRFIAELAQRVNELEGDVGYQPTIYLGLNGALGQLAGDPVRHFDKALEICAGLQESAGSHRLVLEEPIHLDDPTARTANLIRLKESLRIEKQPQKQVEATQLVIDGSTLGHEELAFYAEVRAIQAMMFDLVSTGDIDRVMTHTTKLNAARVGSFIRIDDRTTPRWVKTAIAVAEASRSAGLIVGINDGNDSVYRQIVRHRSETITYRPSKIPATRSS